MGTRFIGQRRNVRIRLTARMSAEVVSRYARGESTRTIAARLDMARPPFYRF